MGTGRRHFDAQVNTSFFKKVERKENEQSQRQIGVTRHGYW